MLQFQLTMKEKKQKNTVKKAQKVQIKSNRNIPYGRDAVKKAILDSAEKLLVTKSAAEISVREIAKTANIKHPLIFRHFGTKEEVIRAVHTRNIKKIGRVVVQIDNLEGNVGFIFEAVKKNRFRQIALSRAMIDGVDLRLVQTDYPVMGHLLKLFEKKRNDEDGESKFDPQIMAAFFAAASLGWFLYEPFLIAATEMENRNKEETQEKIINILEEILQKLC